MIGLIIDILIPRFKTEAFCMDVDGEGIFEIICNYKYRDVGEKFDAVIDISYLNLFGLSLFADVKQETFRKFERKDVL